VIFTTKYLEILARGRSDVAVGCPSVGELFTILVGQLVRARLEYLHHDVGSLPWRR
jgi:hypothetical protein